MLSKITIYNVMDIKTVKEMLLKITNGKFRLYNRDEFNENIVMIKNETIDSISFNIEKDIDVYQARGKVENFVKQKLNNIDDQKLYNILLIFTELATNMIKHANSGTAEVLIKDRDLYMIFIDKGNGISLDRIPYIALSSYSSVEDSLGFGFTICIALSDSIVMQTSSEGTNIIVNIKL